MRSYVSADGISATSLNGASGDGVVVDRAELHEDFVDEGLVHLTMKRLPASHHVRHDAGCSVEIGMRVVDACQLQFVILGQTAPSKCFVHRRAQFAENLKPMLKGKQDSAEVTLVNRGHLVSPMVAWAARDGSGGREAEIDYGRAVLLRQRIHVELASLLLLLVFEMLREAIHEPAAACRRRNALRRSGRFRWLILADCLDGSGWRDFHFKYSRSRWRYIIVV
ncbi:hypothetical protein KKY_2661 [Pelagibacterium halotolerans B2]|uniref:Uncharacterized protein n=1 Tax=Pelagibacterium halotolerans (strain DSM 22347 / JCM 15775 / CGMCC 1.7692 / B2) TaxID=1082931 RepID=G4RBJ3_PELHB|nr:hypothetical protein KKY_2661 [Pelagibacterium halotolerans B2]